MSTDPILEVAETLTDLASDKLAPAPYLAHVAKTGVDVRARALYLGEIEEGTSEWVAQALVHLGSGPVSLYLNTPGGSVTDMFALHDLFRSQPADSPIIVYGYGMVASAGVLLLACGHQRLVTESCVLMSHENKGLGGDDLGFREAKDRRKWEDWMHTFWCDLMARYTPQDADWWKRTTERKAEYWLLGGDAIVAAGLADRVLR